MRFTVGLRNETSSENDKDDMFEKVLLTNRLKERGEAIERCKVLRFYDTCSLVPDRGL